MHGLRFRVRIDQHITESSKLNFSKPLLQRLQQRGLIVLDGNDVMGSFVDNLEWPADTSWHRR